MHKIQFRSFLQQLKIFLRRFEMKEVVIDISSHFPYYNDEKAR